jgi:hypothetical protein
MNRDFLLSIKNFRLGGLSPRSQRIFVLAATTILLTAIIAFATIPGPNGVINSCYHKNDGELRVVESPDQCKSNEEALTFNQTGPQGPEGPQGPAGPSGTSQVYAVYAPGPFFVNSGYPAGNPLVATKDVPAGTYVINVKLTAVNDDAGGKHNLFCNLSTGDNAAASVTDRNFPYYIDGNAGYASIHLQDVYTFSAPGTIQVLCRGEIMNVQDVVLTALKVDSVQ